MGKGTFGEIAGYSFHTIDAACQGSNQSSQIKKNTAFLIFK